MTKLFITNAFSINMLSNCVSLTFIPLNNKQYIKPEFINNPEFTLTPAIGHADTAHVVQNDLNVDVELFNRISVQPDFKAGDMMLVAQYTGARLPEGATTLPEGSKITYWLVRK